MTPSLSTTSNRANLDGAPVHLRRPQSAHRHHDELGTASSLASPLHPAPLFSRKRSSSVASTASRARRRLSAEIKAQVKETWSLLRIPRKRNDFLISPFVDGYWLHRASLPHLCDDQSLADMARSKSLTAPPVERRSISADALQSWHKHRQMNRIASGASHKTLNDRTPLQARTMFSEAKLGGVQLDISAAKIDGLGSVLVAIDIRYVLPQYDLKQADDGLDIAIVIDNSIHASRRSFFRSLDLTRAIVRHLDPRIDRISVLCSASGSAAGSEASVYLPPSRPDLSQLQETLDGIVRVLAPPSDSYLTRASKAAQLCFEGCTRAASSTPQTHTIVLTSNVDALEGTEGLDMSCVHVICPAGLAFNRHNRPGSSNFDFPVMAVQDVEAAQDLTLQTLFDSCRAFGRLPSVQDLHILIDTSRDMQLQEVVGPIQHALLHPGVHQTVMLRLTPVTAAQTQNASHEGLADALEEQIDNLLSMVSVPRIQVRLVYRHPCLPKGTSCVVSALQDLPCVNYVERANPQAQDATACGSVHALLDQYLFHKSLVSSVRDLTSTVYDTYSTVSVRIAEAPMWPALVAELKYQLRLSTKLDRISLRRRQKQQSIRSADSGSVLQPLLRITRSEGASSTSSAVKQIRVDETASLSEDRRGVMNSQKNNNDENRRSMSIQNPGKVGQEDQRLTLSPTLTRRLRENLSTGRQSLVHSSRAGY